MKVCNYEPFALQDCDDGKFVLIVWIADRRSNAHGCKQTCFLSFSLLPQMKEKHVTRVELLAVGFFSTPPANRVPTAMVMRD